MAMPTPRYTPAVGASPAGAEGVRPAARTPLKLEPVSPAPERKRGRPRWTLMLVPPPRVPAPVRSVELKRRHALPPLVALVAVIAFVAYGSAQVGVWTHEAMMEPQMEQLHLRFDDAESRLRVLTDSVALVGARTAALTAARDVAAARAVSAGAQPGVVLPVDGRITSRFAPKRLHPILRIYRPHRGLDIAAPSGTAITAPAPGRVTRVAREIGYGLVVHLDHGGGVVTRYAHLKSVQVETGQLVDEGVQIATVGSSGLATAPHLHYEVRVNGEARDPMRTPIEYRD
jgi:murein DD-endopeptidase MepM/ murein hydrolase activator NlpD